jgi:hypothetical protein
VPRQFQAASASNAQASVPYTSIAWMNNNRCNRSEKSSSTTKVISVAASQAAAKPNSQ